jgi:hypothetical protein
MKKYLFNLLLLMSIQIWSQNTIRNQYQKENFELAKNTLKNGNYLVSVREFLAVHDMNTKS